MAATEAGVVSTSRHAGACFALGAFAVALRTAALHRIGQYNSPTTLRLRRPLC